MGMTKEDRETYWSLSFDTYYKAYYQELASQALAARWERIDVLTALLVAATASGSTLAGWALWSDVGWKVVWAGIAAVATITSILHGSLRVPSRLKEQEELRREFSGLRVDLDTFRQFLRIPETEAPDHVKENYERLRQRLGSLWGRARPDIAYTGRLRDAVQKQLDEVLKEQGAIQ